MIGGKINIKTRLTVRVVGIDMRGDFRPGRAVRPFGLTATADDRSLNVAAAIIIMAEDIASAPRSNQEGDQEDKNRKMSDAELDYGRALCMTLLVSVKSKSPRDPASHAGQGANFMLMSAANFDKT